MIKKFNKKEDYTNKWCLTKKTCCNSYDSIFIYDIRDGIVRYVFENRPELIMYEDVEYFEDSHCFFINPIQSEPL